MKEVEEREREGRGREGGRKERKQRMRREEQISKLRKHELGGTCTYICIY